MMGEVTAVLWQQFAADEPDADFTRIYPFVAPDGEEPMTEVTTKPLGATVGAEVLDVDRDGCSTTTDRPRRSSRAGRYGALVFRDAASRRRHAAGVQPELGTVETVGRRAEIFRVTLDPAKNPAADYLKGTFDWHLDGTTEDIPIMATVLSADAGARARAATPSSPAPTQRSTTSTPTSRSGRSPPGSCTRSRPRSATPSRPVARGAGVVAQAPGRRCTRWCGSTRPGGARSCSARRPSHVEGMDEAEGRAQLDDAPRPVDRPRARLPARMGGR